MNDFYFWYIKGLLCCDCILHNLLYINLFTCKRCVYLQNLLCNFFHILWETISHVLLASWGSGFRLRVTVQAEIVQTGQVSVDDINKLEVSRVDTDVGYVTMRDSRDWRYTSGNIEDVDFIRAVVWLSSSVEHGRWTRQVVGHARVRVGWGLTHCSSWTQSTHHPYWARRVAWVCGNIQMMVWTHWVCVVHRWRCTVNVRRAPVVIRARIW